MAKITKDEIKHLAELANLTLSDEEVDSLGGDLNDIVAYIEQLSELNTEGVEPTYMTVDLEDVWRDDEVIDYGLTRENLLALAPDQADDQIKVPKVL
ncbi:MAG: Asp-tRNA(Asn)/Glu-tRNA(Gln) amidotransferase subunit GatC [Candidatus Nomurabacteria bacterium]|jgi:aspartyl-tRNA(Asn)/glutamyl-tRNA(Gln) amidotransferase subunit C|nr:Asp-tRNA(Asn)/Glu-tRNA(Gln) amidotransferase subunit GatC [Candidatus Nomurabacteria bacterium]